MRRARARWLIQCAPHLTLSQLATCHAANFHRLELPSDVAQSLAMLRGGLPGARWIDPENYHLSPCASSATSTHAVAREVALCSVQVSRPPLNCGSTDCPRSAGGVRGR